MSKVNENIRSFRKFRGLSQESVAKQVNRSTNVISNWENGVHSPDLDACEELCKILQVTPNELFGWEENKDYINYKKRLFMYQEQIQKLMKQKEIIDKEIHDLETRKYKEYPPEDFAGD